MGKTSTAQELLRVAHPWLTGFGFILAYPAAAVFAKRLHDRNKTGWLAALLIVPMLIETVLDPAGGVTQTELVHWIYRAAATMTLVVGIWFLIETRLPARHGRGQLLMRPTACCHARRAAARHRPLSRPQRLPMIAPASSVIIGEVRYIAWGWVRVHSLITLES